jgi:hypothetical protein
MPEEYRTPQLVSVKPGELAVCRFLGEPEKYCLHPYVEVEPRVFRCRPCEKSRECVWCRQGRSARQIGFAAALQKKEVEVLIGEAPTETDLIKQLNHETLQYMKRGKQPPEDLRAQLAALSERARRRKVQEWVPVVMQLSNGALLDLAGNLCRGLLLEVSRDPGKKNGRMRARVLAAEVPEVLPVAFDLRPIVERVLGFELPPADGLADFLENNDGPDAPTLVPFPRPRTA